MAGFQGRNERSFQDFEGWKRAWNAFLVYIRLREALAQDQIQSVTPLEESEPNEAAWNAPVGQFPASPDHR